MKVDRAFRLRIRSGPVEDGDFAAAIDRERHLERAVAQAVVVDIVGEADRLLRNIFLDQYLHRFTRAVEQHVACSHIGFAAEAVAQLAHARRRRAAAGDQAIRSARFMSGVRVLLSMMSRTPLLSVPFS